MSRIFATRTQRRSPAVAARATKRAETPPAAPPPPPAFARQMGELPPHKDAPAKLPAELHELCIARHLLAASGVPDGCLLNPSIAIHKGILWCVVRVQQAKGRSYNFMGSIETSGGAWILEGVRELVAAERVRPALYGFEDVRLFVHGGRLWGSATVFDSHAQMVVLELEAHRIVSASRQPSAGRHEKNWMPVALERPESPILPPGWSPTPARSLSPGVWFLYRLEPQPIVLRYDFTAREVRPPLASLEVGKAGTLRGGSQIVPYGDGFVGVVHELHTPPVVYLHRLVRFDRFLQVVAMSEPFYFDAVGVEFCAGLAAWAGRWVFSFGQSDERALVAVVEPSVLSARIGAP